MLTFANHSQAWLRGAHGRGSPLASHVKSSLLIYIIPFANLTPPRYFYAVTTPSAPAHYPTLELWLHKLLGPIISNGSLNVMVFMALASRLIANRWLARGTLQDLAESIHRRVPRLMFPVTAAILGSYFLNEANAYYWVATLPSRTWSTWAFIQNYKNFGVFLK